MTIGENIKHFRKEKGLTQKELGNLCGINEVQIRRYELGGSNPKLETIQKIATALGVEPYALDDRLFNISIGHQTLQYLQSELQRIDNYSGDIAVKEKYRKEQVEKMIIQLQNELNELENNNSNDIQLLSGSSYIPKNGTNTVTYSLEDNEQAEFRKKMAQAFSQLNSMGREKALEQIELLSKIPEYQKDHK